MLKADLNSTTDMPERWGRKDKEKRYLFEDQFTNPATCVDVDIRLSIAIQPVHQI